MRRCVACVKPAAREMGAPPDSSRDDAQSPAVREPARAPPRGRRRVRAAGAPADGRRGAGQLPPQLPSLFWGALGCVSVLGRRLHRSFPARRARHRARARRRRPAAAPPPRRRSRRPPCRAPIPDIQPMAPPAPAAPGRGRAGRGASRAPQAGRTRSRWRGPRSARAGRSDCQGGADDSTTDSDRPADPKAAAEKTRARRAATTKQRLAAQNARSTARRRLSQVRRLRSAGAADNQTRRAPRERGLRRSRRSESGSRPGFAIEPACRPFSA